ncbi:MAG: Crp/Fnr family transcriptional regulator [Deltaproteobacteria bacterium]|nr:Crp/Fnr family transcriptional regulator [Deltaproteobacteria bacterium]
MKCICQELAGDDIELSPVCVGNLWMFQSLQPEEARALAGQAMRRRYAKGEVIFYQGDAANQMFLIKGGVVKLSKVTEEGAEITLDIRGPGDSLGENMLNEEPGTEFPVTASCLQDTIICGFTRQGFESLVLAHPNIGLMVIRNLSQRIESLTSRVGSMSHTTLEERLYQVLCTVAKEHGQATKRGLALAMPFTHEELAFLVGAHRVSITRAMKALKEAGRIIQDGRTLILAA